MKGHIMNILCIIRRVKPRNVIIERDERLAYRPASRTFLGVYVGSDY